MVSVPPRRQYLISPASDPRMPVSTAWKLHGSAARMTLRNTGKPAGFSAVVNPAMAPMMRRAMQKDLPTLKHILEV